MGPLWELGVGGGFRGLSVTLQCQGCCVSLVEGLVTPLILGWFEFFGGLAEGPSVSLRCLGSLATPL